MEQEKPSNEILHIYAVGPVSLNEVQVEHVKRALKKLIDKRGFDPHYVYFNCNEEDKAMKGVLETLQANDYPGLTIHYFKPNFERHRKKAYIKRNQAAIIRSSHMMLFVDGTPNRSQEAIMRQAEDSMKYLVYKHVNVGVDHVKKE